VFRVHQLPQKTKKPVGQNTLKEQRNRWKTEKTIAFFAITSSRGIESNEKTVTISPPRSDVYALWMVRPALRNEWA